MGSPDSVKSFFDDYISAINIALQDIDRHSLEQVVDELARAWREERHVFLMGNGGSAAMASHMTNDLNKLTIVPTQRRLRAVSLADNVPLITAWANDSDYDHVFAEQLHGLCRPGDVVIAFSCSGNSRNVLTALRLASEIGASTIGITGDTGGKMASEVDICVLSPIGAIYQQEDIHLVLSHMLSTALKARITAISQRSVSPPRALILAAGEGTRLRPYTLDRPKPMLPIADRPMMEYTIDWLKELRHLRHRHQPQLSAAGRHRPFRRRRSAWGEAHLFPGRPRDGHCRCNPQAQRICRRSRRWSSSTAMC